MPARSSVPISSWALRTTQRSFLAGGTGLSAMVGSTLVLPSSKSTCQASATFATTRPRRPSTSRDTAHVAAKPSFSIWRFAGRQRSSANSPVSRRSMSASLLCIRGTRRRSEST